MKRREGYASVARAVGASIVLAAVATVAAGETPVTHGGCRDATVQAEAAAAKSLARDKRYDDAADSARAVLEKCEGEPMATAALGEALVAKKEYQQAAEAMTKAVAVNKDLAAAYLWRGYAYHYLESRRLRDADFERFLSLDPDAPEGDGVRRLLARGR